MRGDPGRAGRGGRALVALVLSCAAVLLAGTASGPASGPVPRVEPPAGAAAAVLELERITRTRNDADVAFVREMVPHHQQGVELADLVAARTGTLEVRDMAFRISRAQGFEIGQLRGFLTAWGTGPAPHAGPHGDMAGMAGMVAPDRMAALRGARGPAFDRLWLDAMIAHHEGAVGMAQAELRDGVNRGVRNTASNVVAVQRAEIDTMRALLGR